MFKFLKDKLKEAISGITKKVESDAETEAEPEVKTKVEEPEEITKEEIKKSFFKKLHEKVILTKITKEKFEELFSDIELALLENNVANEIVERIRSELEKDLVDIPIKRNEVSSIIKSSFKKVLEDIISIEKIDIYKRIKESGKKPFVILFLGYNGVGKSLTVAKLAKFLKDKNLKVMLAAGDTFRAAGASQLAQYAEKVNVPVIKGKYGSDSCSIIFDTISSARARNYDVVIADTAGRIHNNQNLLNELKKINKVNNPDFNILVIDAMTGSDVVNQAEEFGKSVKIDALIITKSDTYEKGGALLSAVYILKKPILFLGTGQGFDDLNEYNKEEMIKNLGF